MIIGANIDKHADGCEKRDGNQTGLRQFVKCPHQWPEDPRYLRVPHAPAQPSPGKMNKNYKKDLVGKVFIGFYLEKPSFHTRWNTYCCLTWLSSCYANVRWQCTLRYSSSFRSPTQLYWMLLEMLIHVHTQDHSTLFRSIEWIGQGSLVNEYQCIGDVSVLRGWGYLQQVLNYFCCILLRLGTVNDGFVIPQISWNIYTKI